MSEPRRIEDPAVYVEIKDWAAIEIDEGRSVESCTEELLGNGWHPDDVEAVVEDARRRVFEGHGARRSAKHAAADFAAPTFLKPRNNLAPGPGMLLNLIESITRLFSSKNKPRR